MNKHRPKFKNKKNNKQKKHKKTANLFKEWR